MEVTIRTAVAEEASALAGLQRTVSLEAYGCIFPPEAPPPTLDALAEQWTRDLDASTPSRRVFVAVSSARMFGMVMAGPDERDESVGHLSRLYVQADRWGTGVGRLLYDRAISHLVGAGFRVATLWVLEHNLRARRWYERLGWEPTGERSPVYEPARIDDVGYRLDLSRP